VEIGSVPAPLEWMHWKAAEALLEPARVLGGFASVIEPDEALWAVMDGGELLACATAWLGEGFVEVKLVGGRDYRRWLGPLNDMIGAAAKDAGATWMQATGRAGWRKSPSALGWAVMGEVDGTTIYRREL
jgi:hypothetical protein